MSESIEQIAVKNNVLITKVITYCCATLGIDKEELVNDTKHYLQQLYTTLRFYNGKKLSLNRTIEEYKNDLDLLRASYVGGQDFSTAIGEGRNTGGRRNSVEEKHIKALSLEAQIRDTINEKWELQKSLQANNLMMKDFTYLLTNKDYAYVIECAYMNCQKDIDIFQDLQYRSFEFIRQAKFRGIKALAKMVEYSIKNEK